MLKKSLGIIGAGLLISSVAGATEIYNNDGTTVALTGTIKFGYVSNNSRLPNDKAHLSSFAFVDETLDKTSKLGISGSRQVSDDMKVFAAYEWAMNPLANPNDGSDAGYMTPRFGYAGLDHTTYGKISFGKQNGVYKDVASFTEKFDVSGSLGGLAVTSGKIFGAGDLGAFTGTGKADASAQYRKKFGPVALGLQYQAHGTNNQIATLNNAPTPMILDRDLSAGISVVSDIMQGLKGGIAFNYAKLDITGMSGEKVDRMDGVIGAVYDKDGFTLALTGSYNTNYFQKLSLSTDMKDGTQSMGQESFIAYRMNSEQLFVGNNYMHTTYDASNKGNTIDANILIVGYRHHFTPAAYVSLEYSYDLRSENAIKLSTNNRNKTMVGAIIKYDF
ncbi:MAG: porin [Alphaproteobacteria bacterium]|jgi:predicted porin|nr:porin [Alphaproteobacteria bacterium]